MNDVKTVGARSNSRAVVSLQGFSPKPWRLGPTKLGYSAAQLLGGVDDVTELAVRAEARRSHGG
jgi:hypothetical protein